MQIDLPEEGVYGVLDHAVEKTKGQDGFQRVKVKVTNTTALIDTPNRGSVAQDMAAGSFMAMARFHRNTCYLSELRGQIGEIGRAQPGGPVTASNPWRCRNPVEEIVVSNSATQWVGDATTGSAVAMSALRTGEGATLAFDFPNPIPIEATDLYLQAVFRGRLGEEDGAVAVTTKDVSEPSFLSFMNASYYRICRTDFQTVNHPSGPIDCGR